MAQKTQYVKLKHEEHVLKRPDTYVGSIEPTEEDLYVLTDGKMSQETITRIPGEYKLFDEIIVNAHDQWVRCKEQKVKVPSTQLVKNIKISFSKETGEISVYNDGEGIPVEIHPTENVYIPEMIFGSLLTSSNYNDGDLKHVGGKNGYGAKLTNIFSTKFCIETRDKHSEKRFEQTFYDNMKRRDKAKVNKDKKKPYTKITYIPDYKRFGKSGLTDEMCKIIIKRAYDLAGCMGKEGNVFVNDEKINITNFQKYMELYIGAASETPRAYEVVSDRWTVGVCLSPSMTFTQVSFVNGIVTNRGGKHVDMIANQVSKKLAEMILKKKKQTVKPNFIKENLMIFVKATIDNPSFNSQTKEYLDTAISKFGSKCELSKSFMDNVAKCGIMERACELSSVKDGKNLKKTDGKKANHVRGIPKLEDANWAGTKKSAQCTLILTEGDSAKAMAMAGISNVGRDQFGIFPLRGKLMNVRDEKNMKKLLENKEINAIKKIIGLQSGKTYKSVDELRYGHVLLLTDQDEDGSHIKGLLFNLFEKLWPSLFHMDGFLQGMLTPVVKAKKGKVTKNFYSVKDFIQWNETNGTGWSSKYYKGLGTSTPAEAKEYFKDPKIIQYTSETNEDTNSIHLAFGKNTGDSDKRKNWLYGYSEDNTLDYSKKKVTVSQFVNQDLIHFSNSDNIRSLPHLMDGLKPSQRKVLYCCFKRNLTNEIRVAQLAGYVSEHGAYHHGEASLQGTIVNMAQNFVGSNNMNLLEPIGQFGSRIEGGKDAAQPRYIHTALEPIAFQLFDKRDTPLLQKNIDDGMEVEPKYYVPVLPMILVNGVSGIGTGWSTEIPKYNPKDIIDNIQACIKGETMAPMVPWYKGFTGTIHQISPTQFVTRGKYTISGNKLEIFELPVGLWTDKFKEFLENQIIETTKDKKKHGIIKHYDSYCTDTRIHFVVHFPPGELAKSKWSEEVDANTKATRLEKTFKLINTISTTNMHYYDCDFKITKSVDPREIIQKFVAQRLAFYQKRKIHILTNLNEEVSLLEVKIRFIYEYIHGKLAINNKRKAEIVSILEKANYPKQDNDYDYLLRMPLYSLTKDKIEELEEKLANRKNERDLLSKQSKETLWNLDIQALKTKLNEKPKTTIIIKKKKKGTK